MVFDASRECDGQLAGEVTPQEDLGEGAVLLAAIQAYMAGFTSSTQGIATAHAIATLDCYVPASIPQPALRQSPHPRNSASLFSNAVDMR